MSFKLAEMLQPEIFYLLELDPKPGVSENYTEVAVTYLPPSWAATSAALSSQAINFTNEVSSLKIPPFQTARLTLFPAGCDRVHQLDLFTIQQGTLDQLFSKELDQFECGGVSNMDGLPITGFTVTIPSSTIPRTVLVGAIFDQNWNSQQHPDPPVGPMSHIARLRLDEV
eukprot:Gregarina_sp_Poly_1__3330@NODE_195_length_11596_cov_85_481395_g174_i0_p8_GENE_NODE_195_length_11596_cov_85_481395_g174_i0NODE_195_length_11596_cov_85_481395_g174_i0_p8_ORF_typecomplete_len170_score19_70_NODE_195_length_11596_cov_85_481395_g174_i0983810347